MLRAFLLFVSLLAIVFPKEFMEEEGSHLDQDWIDTVEPYDEDYNQEKNESTESFCRGQFAGLDDSPKDGYIEKEELSFSHTHEYVNYAFEQYDVDGDGKMNHTGRGIVTDIKRSKGEFMLEYAGEKSLEMREKDEKVLYPQCSDIFTNTMASHGAKQRPSGPVILFTGVNMKKYTIDEFLKISLGQQRTEYTSDVTHLVCAGDHKQFSQGLTLKMFHALLDGICIVDIGWIYDSVIRGQLFAEDDYKIIGERRFGKWPTGINRRYKFSCQILGKLEDITYDEMKCRIQKMGGSLVEGEEMEPDYVILAEPDNVASRNIPDAVDKQWVFDCIIRGVLQSTEEYLINSKEAPPEGCLTDIKTAAMEHRDDNKESKLENNCPESSAVPAEECLIDMETADTENRDDTEYKSENQCPES